MKKDIKLINDRYNLYQNNLSFKVVMSKFIYYIATLYIWIILISFLFKKKNYLLKVGQSMQILMIIFIESFKCILIYWKIIVKVTFKNFCQK